MICTEDEVALMPVKDDSALRARLVDGGCHNFANMRSGKVWRATPKEQKITNQVWRIPHEKININVLRKGWKRHRSICKRRVFNLCWDGEIHPRTDKP